MARASDRLPENAPGPFFVDSSCIDCDLCRQLAPEVFSRSEGGQSFVARQPRTAGEVRRAGMALITCPTASIGVLPKPDLSPSRSSLPEDIDGDVFFCGYAAESSFGASSYLVRRPGGNVLVDSPRAAGPLLAKLTEWGGVALLFLTHRDDVAFHDVLRKRFGCRRVLHRDDVGSGTRSVELQPEGRDPVRLAEDLLMIPVPGHTRGSSALLYRGRFLFTGDHLWAEDDGHLAAGRGVCWYSWREQTRSMERLLDFDFEWVLPGHGRRFHAGSPLAMRRELERAIGEMKRAA